ncbi:MAG: 50S ribosomal protein L32 [Deltaproteobacteria bacterium]|nr:50S ribosomal protein L32 [Deltaproteobacteria bacterium]
MCRRASTSRSRRDSRRAHQRAAIPGGLASEP